MNHLKRIAFAPFIKYNEQLEKSPLSVKCITSGGLYAGGDLLAQYAETYNANLGKKESDHVTTTINYKRLAVFFVFGTIVGGPAYHYWFNYLNELPAVLWRLKQTRQRGNILRSYAFLKSHGIEVNLDMAKLPKAAPLGKWKGKAAKIAADQLIFAPIYLLTFFMGIGILNGASERLATIYARDKSTGAPPASIAATETPRTGPKSSEHLLDDLLTQLKEHIAENEEFSSNAELENEQYKLINQIFTKVKRTQELRERQLTWNDIVLNSWNHTKGVFLSTYQADCIVWPPLQLINFTFIPLRFQFLFVNIANIGWNTFLSFMANKKH